MSDTASRLIELAEDRLRVADGLGLSVAGLVGLVYSSVDDGDHEKACEHLEAIDKLINEARLRAEGAKE